MPHPDPGETIDRMIRFLLPDAGVRGVHVRLEDTWRQIRSRDDYPVAVEELLGETTVAAALFTAHAKIEGRLSIQMRGQGTLRTLFAECTAAGTLRGIAQMAGDAGPMPNRDLRSLAGDATLAITIENPSAGAREAARYQGLVPIESESLAEAFESYFRQSEQLPTRLLLAVDGDVATGLILQKLPGDAGDDDGWNRATALFETLPARELLDTPADRLLHRLFHEEAVEDMGQRSLRFACSCSKARVESMLQALGREEATAAAASGEAEIRCEFCGERYVFSPAEIDALFTAPGAQFEAPRQLQ